MMLIARLVPLLAILIAWPALAHEGHDHGDAASAVAQALPRVQSRSDVFELVAVASGHKLTIYLSDFKTNAPVPEAAVEVGFEGKSIPAVRSGEGVYRITADWLDVPGSKPLVFMVVTPAVSDLLDGVLEIAPPPAAAAYNVAFADLVRSRLLWAWTLLAAATGFVIALAFARRTPIATSGVRAADEQRSTPKARAASILSIGAAAIAGLLLLSPQALAASHDHGSEGEALIGIDMARRMSDGSVFMPKPAQWLLGVRTSITETAKAARTVEMVGTVIPDPSASGRVQASLAGRVEVANGRLPHVGQQVSQGEVMALLSPSVPAFDRGTTDAQVAEIAGAIEIAEQKARRYAGVAPGTVPQKDIDQVNAELAALKARRAALRPVGGPETLKAPISGIVAAANVHLGQVVDARETLFEIVDPDKLWIEAIGTELQDVQGILSAIAVTSDKTARLSFIGRAPALKQQAQPLLFRVDQPIAALAVGRPVTVLVESKQVLSGIVVPASAVVRASNGLPQVWEHVAAERFEAIAVRTAPLDGRNVLITAGVKEGTRLVIEGAEFINQVR
jgi:cobalt-zinc-cadmium efflux system membrane fusion protein